MDLAGHDYSRYLSEVWRVAAAAQKAAFNTPATSYE
jgi:hypothetical protein